MRAHHGVEEETVSLSDVFGELSDRKGGGGTFSVDLQALGSNDRRTFA